LKPLSLIQHTSSPSFPPLIVARHFSSLIPSLCPFLQEAAGVRSVRN